MSAYAGFAAFYDTLMDDFDYPAWAGLLYEAARRGGRSAHRNSATARAARARYQLNSPDAAFALPVRIFRAKCWKSHRKRRGARAFGGCSVREDMTKLTLPRPVDAIVCGCDGVNYLTSDQAVLAFFRRAYASLRPGGAFAFDISSPYKLESVIGNGFFGEERDDVAYLAKPL